MKKFARSVLYVFSIVIAVGIGMPQSGKSYQGSVRCNAKTVYKDCKKIATNSEPPFNLVPVIECGTYETTQGVFPGPGEVATDGNISNQCYNVGQIDCGGTRGKPKYVECTTE